jgi:hypothetical protein
LLKRLEAVRLCCEVCSVAIRNCSFAVRHNLSRFFCAFGDLQSRDQALKLAKRIVILDWIARWEEDIDVNKMADQEMVSGLVDNMFMQIIRHEGKVLEKSSLSKLNGG